MCIPSHKWTKLTALRSTVSYIFLFLVVMQNSDNKYLNEVMGNRKKPGARGMCTPPTQSSLPVISPQQVQSSGHDINGRETSSILSQANDVLYMHQNKISSDILHQPANVLTSQSRPSVPCSIVNNQYTPEVPLLQFNDQQSKYQDIPMTHYSANFGTTVVNSDQIRGPSVPPPGPPPYPPPWLSSLLQSLDTRLQNIEGQLNNQNSRWHQIHGSLQSQGTMLQNQNVKILSIEKQISEINNLKKSVTYLECKVHDLDTELKDTHSTLVNYSESIAAYSDMCDEVVKGKTYSDSQIRELSERVEKLEVGQKSLNINQIKAESTIIDLQCRSMRDNLIFTGIREMEVPWGDPEAREDVEATLRNFLASEMHIRYEIPFHRVHRLGIYNRATAEENPRPIIAKFEKFKDREFVRSEAPKTLKDKHFGVREQFPKIIEEKRKLLYPEAKIARRDKSNKVRLIRDKLYINNVEFQPKPREGTEISRNRYLNDNINSSNDKQTASYQQEPTNSNTYTGSRVFYGNKAQRWPVGKKSVNFSVSSANRFEVLSKTPECNMPSESLERYESSSTRKHPASSPLEELSLKKHREDNQHGDIDPDSSDDSDSSVMQLDSSQSSPRARNFQQTPLHNNVEDANCSTESVRSILNVGPILVTSPGKAVSNSANTPLTKSSKSTVVATLTNSPAALSNESKTDATVSNDQQMIQA